MSEIPAPGIRPTENPQEEMAKIIQLNTRESRPDPTELDDIAKIDVFLSQYRHPSMSGRDPAFVADKIRKQTDPYLNDREVHELTDEECVWRQTLLDLAVDSTDIDMATLDEIAGQDPVYNELLICLMTTKSSAADFKFQRQALRGLQGLRLGTWLRGTAGSDEDWLRIIALLFPGS